MATLCKSSVRACPAARASRRTTVVCQASLKSKAAAVATAGALLIASPSWALETASYSDSTSYEAQLRSAIQNRGVSELSVPEPKEEKAPAPKVKAAPVVAVEEVAAPEPVATMSAEERTAAIRAEAIKDAEVSAKITAEVTGTKVKPAVVGAPAARQAINSSSSGEGNNTALLAIGALAVVGVGAAAASQNKGEEATPTPAAPTPAPEAPAADSTSSNPPTPSA